MAHYEKAKGLMYGLVDVETSINRSKDFKSEFVLPDQEDERSLTFTGYLKAIDPISHSVILCHIHETESPTIANNILILGRNICDIRQSARSKHDEIAREHVEVLVQQGQTLSNHPYFQKPSSSQSLTTEELIATQTKIVNWFKKYRIPIELNGKTQELVVAGCVRIKPPYEHESDFICPTRVVFKRIKHFVDTSKQD